MPDYIVHVTCDECRQNHSAQVRLFLARKLETEQSLAEIFAGEEIPKAISTLLTNNRCLCTQSGKEFIQSDSEKVFLRPSGDEEFFAAQEARRPGIGIPVDEPAPDPAKMQAEAMPKPQSDQQPEGATGNQQAFLLALARRIVDHPDLPAADRKRWATSLREIATHPLGGQVAGEVLVSILFQRAPI